MFREGIRSFLRRELHGVTRVALVLGLALSVLLLPRISVSQAMTTASFSSPPPGTPTVHVLLPASARLIDKISVKSTVTVDCGPFAQFQYSSVTYTVSQVDNGRVNVANGSLQPAISCQNVPFNYQATATLPDRAAPFHQGSAVAQLTVKACGYSESWQFLCVTETATRNVNLE